MMKTMMTIERSDVEKDWHARGYTCGLWIDHAGRTWRDDQHDTDQLFMALSGQLEVEMEGSQFRPDIGEEVVIPAHVAHTIRNVGGRTARWLYGQKLQNGFAKAI